MSDKTKPGDVEKLFHISSQEIKKFIKDFHSEMRKGLSGRKSSLRMIPTYVKKPKGREEGEFLALDLGGTNFRVLALKLKGNRKLEIPSVMKFALKKRHITKTGKEFFDFIANSIKIFMNKHKMRMNEKHSIGFTFSFPIMTKSVSSGILLGWTKGFNAKGVVGRDVVKLLNKALIRKGLSNTEVVAIANDTVSTLLAKSYEDANCDMGIILGTGTNACYSEKIKNIKKLKEPFPEKEMVINIEWGNFDKLRITKYDRELDRSSANPRQQRLEKMVSGMYLDELVRIILLDLINNRHLFKGRYSSIFKEQGRLKSEYISTIESDKTKNLSKTDKLLERIGVLRSEHRDRKLVKTICDMVTSRAARISAGAMASVLTKMDKNLTRKHTLAIDGSLYEKHPSFSKKIDSALKETFKKKIANIKLTLAKDGSGKGAAILASTAGGLA